jgi:tetratricopeptide (TPR) repeat protein
MNTQSHSQQAILGEADHRQALESVYAVGHWLLSQERFRDAATVFRLMMRTAPTDERGWLALGTCHEKLGQTDVALELYGGGAVAAEPSVLCHLARFRTLWDQDRMDEADEAIDAARMLAEEVDDEEWLVRVEAERRARP